MSLQQFTARPYPFSFVSLTSRSLPNAINFWSPTRYRLIIILSEWYNSSVIKPEFHLKFEFYFFPVWISCCRSVSPSFGVPGPEWVTGLGLAAPSSAAWLQSPISGRSLQEDSVLYILSWFLKLHSVYTRYIQICFYLILCKIKISRIKMKTFYIFRREWRSHL